jgi:hypothetical protein
MADFRRFQAFRRSPRRLARVGAEGFHYFHIFFRDAGKKLDRITSEKETRSAGIPESAIRSIMTPKATTLTRTGERKLSRASGGLRSFAGGVLYGLSAASLFWAGRHPLPQASSGGIASDWKAIGKDLATSLRRHAQ